MEVISTDGRKFNRVSRWIRLLQNCNPGKGNSLWNYVCDENGYHPGSENFNPENGLTLDYFRFGGKTYALDQFYVLGGVWTGGAPIMYEDDDGKVGVIGTVNMDGDMFHPLYGEWDECCEHVRLYTDA